MIDELLRAIIQEELAPLLKANSARPIEDRLLNASQAAEVLQVSERWLYKHADPDHPRQRAAMHGPPNGNPEL